MSLIPAEYLNGVVALGRPSTSIYSDNGSEWFGTGFLLSYPHPQIPKSEKKFLTYLVTTKHNFEDESEISIRFNPVNNSFTRDFLEFLIDENQNISWTGHPNPDIDVAVLILNGRFLMDTGCEFYVFPYDFDTEMVMKVNQMIESQICEGDFCYVLGFPLGKVSRGRKFPITRLGIISRIQDLYQEKESDFIIDAKIYPGNSGGPVILKPEFIAMNGSKAHPIPSLIGMVKSYLPYEETASSDQTGKIRITFEENSGLALVDPMDHIIETIEEDIKKHFKI